MSEPEIWKGIPASRLLGIPSGYQASSLARIRSVPRTLSDGRAAGGTVLALQEDKDGYLTVKLGRKRVRVNIAVQLAFAGPPQVLHLDHDRSNNKPENLAWGSKVVNEQAKAGNRKIVRMEEGLVPPLRLRTSETAEQC